MEYTNEQLIELLEMIVFNQGITSQFADEEYEMLEVIAERLKNKDQSNEECELLEFHDYFAEHLLSEE